MYDFLNVLTRILCIFLCIVSGGPELCAELSSVNVTVVGEPASLPSSDVTTVSEPAFLPSSDYTTVGSQFPCRLLMIQLQQFKYHL